MPDAVIYALIAERIKKKNKLFFRKNDCFLLPLKKSLEENDRRVTVLWALEFAEKAAGELKKKYPFDDRPVKAVVFSKLWASGEIKMPQAKKAILDCHALAKELTCLEDAALCHAVGQACSTVHTAKHAIGFAVYELTSLVYACKDFKSAAQRAEKRIDEYLLRLRCLQETYKNYSAKWADFLMK